MIKKVVATTVLVASAAGVSTAPAMAVGNGSGVANANGAGQMYGNTWTGGYMSPQMGLINGSLNKPCLGIGKLGAQSLIGLLNVGLQDIPILSSQQQQQCTENSTIQDGDDPLSHILDEIPILSDNGSWNREDHEGHGHGHEGHGGHHGHHHDDD
ncbi:rodlin [Streptomyces blastmyceticus]|uniref:Keratin, type I cytoskeletal 12 n=1 Tax=Streptomyces blastmyceticus TaxID=68180 RepID=A0A077K9H4_9ACTN|nr:keratin, type I cytoskeletal 12 [Streptomyces blastmyceticus]